MSQLILTEEAGTPSTPGSGKWKIYPKSDGWYTIDDTGAEVKIGGGAIAFTPSWTNLTVGNGIESARYAVQNKLVDVWQYLVFGSTTSISGAVEISVPHGSMDSGGYAALSPLGLVTMKQGGNYYSGLVQRISSIASRIRAQNASATYLTNVDISSTIPFTWTTGDVLSLMYRYRLS